MRRRPAPFLIALLALPLLVGAARGQDAFDRVHAEAVAHDPFEAIVSSGRTADASLNDLSLPLRNPTRDELRQYFEAFRAVNLSATLQVDDGRGRGRDARLGAFSAPNGTQVRLEAGFERRPGEPEAVLRTLELVPTNPMALGALRFNRMTLDEKGVLHFKLNLRLMGIDFWPQELTVEKIYHDRDGNLVFKTGGSGLATSFVPDMRITPDGRVQRWDRGWWLFGWHGAGWEDVEGADGKPVRLSSTLPIRRWPPTASDILDWLPRPGAEGSTDYGAALEKVPLRDVALRFEARADPKRIVLSNGIGHLDLSEHALSVVAHGSFQGRTYRADPARENSFRAEGSLTGELAHPERGRLELARARFELRGTHAETIPFEDPSRTELRADISGSGRAELSGATLRTTGGAEVELVDGGTAEAEGMATLLLKPLDGDPNARTELRVDRRSRFSVRSAGPIELSELSRLLPEGATVDALRLVPADDPTTATDESRGPVLRLDGQLGTRDGLVYADTDFQLHGATDRPLEVSVPTATGSTGTTLDPGAQVHGQGDSFAATRSRGMSGGGARANVDLRLRGTGRDTHLDADGLRVDLDGRTDVDARLAANLGYDRDSGALTVRGAAGAGSVTLREGTGVVEGGLPGQPSLRTEVGAGSRFELETGHLSRNGANLETDGYARGERKARLQAHLVVGAGSTAHRALSGSFDGRGTVDLDVALGFRVDPVKLAGRESGALTGPLSMELDLALDFAAGSRFAARNTAGYLGQLALRGPMRATLHASCVVDPTTGRPVLQELSGIDVTVTADALDIQPMLRSLGQQANVQVQSRTTLRIRQARVVLLGDAIEIEHDGITLEIAPGKIRIGRPAPVDGALGAPAPRR